MCSGSQVAYCPILGSSPRHQAAQPSIFTFCIIRGNPCKSVANLTKPQKVECGSGPATPSRIMRGFLPSLRHRGRGAMTASARQRSRRSAAFAKAVCRCVILRSRLRNRCGGQQPFPLMEQEEEEEAAMPGQPVRTRARFWKFPPAIRSHESPAAAGSAAIIRQSQELSRFAEHTLRHFVAPRNTKNFPRCAEPVDTETSLWKNEEI